jgi:hypothetical protein
MEIRGEKLWTSMAFLDVGWKLKVSPPFVHEGANLQIRQFTAQ